MLSIPNRQFDDLSVGLNAAFETRVLRHLQQWRPRHCEILGEDGMRGVIRHGWARANAHGLAPESCVMSYVDLMCMLGSGFDADPLLHAWTRPLLSEADADAARAAPDGGDAEPRAPSTAAEAIERGDALHERAWAHIARIAADYRDENGKPNPQHHVELLAQVRGELREPLTRERWPAFSQQTLQMMQRNFPAKMATLDPQTWQGFLEDAVRLARRHGLSTTRGTRVIVILRFVLGHEFDRDPLLPWVTEILPPDAPPDDGDDSTDDGEARIDALLMRGAQALRQWWSYDGARRA